MGLSRPTDRPCRGAKTHHADHGMSGSSGFAIHAAASLRVRLSKSGLTAISGEPNLPRLPAHRPFRKSIAENDYHATYSMVEAAHATVHELRN